jgi:hypothetical protein
MKMEVRPSVYKKLLLVLMGLSLLSACGSDSSEDVASPTLTMDAVAPSTFAATRNLSGQIERGASLDIAVDSDANVGEIKINDGIWECQLSALAVGNNTITLTADDDRGNTSTLLFNLVRDLFIIDQADIRTSQTSSTVHGRLATGDETVTATLNGTAVDPGQVTPIDPKAFRLDLADLDEGTHTVAITVKNAAGETQTKSLSIVRDAEAVSLTINKPTPMPTEEHSLPLTGTVEAGATVAVSVDTGATKGDVTDSWQVTISDLEERDNIVTVTASLADKTASAWTRIVVYSSPTVVTVPANGAIKVSPEVVLTATFSEAMAASSVDETTFLLDGGAVEGKVAYSADDRTATFTPSAPLAPGDHTATIDGVKDPDGNPINDNNWTFTVQ